MAFAMKGGGSRGGLECHIPILKSDFFKNHLESRGYFLTGISLISAPKTFFS